MIAFAEYSKLIPVLYPLFNFRDYYPIKDYSTPEDRSASSTIQYITWQQDNHSMQFLVINYHEYV